MTPLTRDDHKTLADSAQLDGNVCAIISLLLGIGGLAWLSAGRWEGAAALAVSGILLAIANSAFTDADHHHSTAARKDTP